MTLELLQVLLIGSETVAGAQNKELCSVSKDLLAPPAPPPPTVLTPLRSPHPFQHTDNSANCSVCCQWTTASQQTKAADPQATLLFLSSFQRTGLHANAALQRSPFVPW